MSTKFIHLRVCSDYSFGKSNTQIKQLIGRCVDVRSPAICLSDTCNLFGSLEFSTISINKGVQPIIGCVFSINCDDFITRYIEGWPNQMINMSCGVRSSNSVKNLANVLVIVKNEIGYNNLLHLMGHYYLDHDATGHNFNYITLDVLLQHIDGLILLCGMHNSIIEHLIKNYGSDAADKFILLLLQHTLKTEVFIELTRYATEQNDKQLELALLDIAYKYDLPIVATNPVYYLDSTMFEAIDVLGCIIGGRYMIEDNRLHAHKEHYFKSEKEMMELFVDLPEAIENTVIIAKKCSFLLKEKSPQLPKFCPEGVDEAQVLSEHAVAGLKKRLETVVLNGNDDVVAREYYDRLYIELDVINGMNFPGYFLIVEDFIAWSKSCKIPVGPGRGSGAGSVVTWSLGITDVDPIKFGLIFERFLNKDRVSMPDIDIDFCQARREEVINYVRDKYGPDKVSGIITFGKMQSRAVLRDVGRVLQLPYSVVDKICKMIPHNPVNPITLQEVVNMDDGIQALMNDDPNIHRLLMLGIALEGTHRHVSLHPAGLVVGNKPLVDVVPIYKDDNMNIPVIQYNIKYVEAGGLVKFDFLGLKTLTVIDQALHLIQKTRGEIINMDMLPLDDVEVYKLLSEGRAIGVFQFEAAAMREVVKSLRPDSIHDIIALTSLNRPGPKENISHYINRKHGIEKIEYAHPMLEDILRETYGIFIYQEQVLEAVKYLAGYTFSAADILRKAMGKKEVDEMTAQREIFADGASKHMDRSKAMEIFDVIAKFAGYGFNKAHATSYAIISYYTAYLKAHYANEFFVASINLEVNNSEKIHLFCIDAEQIGIKILTPCINASFEIFVLEGANIRFGLSGIKGMATKILHAIVKNRNDNGVFKNIFDFVKRIVPHGLNRRMLEILAKSGALNNIHANNAQIIANSSNLIRYGQQYIDVRSKDKRNLHDTTGAGIENYMKQGVISLSFDDVDNHDDCNVYDMLERTPEFSFDQRLSLEYEVLGFYLSAHPLDPYMKKLRKIGISTSDIISVRATQNGTRMIVAGIVTDVNIRSRKASKMGKGGRFAFLQVSDCRGMMDLSLFNSELLHEVEHLLVNGKLVCCTITARKTDSGVQCIVDNIQDVNVILHRATSYYEITVHNVNAISVIRDMVSKDAENRGLKKVKLSVTLDDGSIVHIKTPDYFKLSAESIEVLRRDWRVDMDVRECE